jgi:hypothetical protein
MVPTGTCGRRRIGRGDPLLRRSVTSGALAACWSLSVLMLYMPANAQFYDQSQLSTLQGILAKQADHYALTSESATFLDRRSPLYLGGTLRFFLSAE